MSLTCVCGCFWATAAKRTKRSAAFPVKIGIDLIGFAIIQTFINFARFNINAQI